MQDRPSACELLIAAIEALEQHLMPSVPAHLRRHGAMIAQSLRIVQRHLQMAEALEAEERAVLREVVEADPEAPLADMNWRLAEKIRAGQFASAEEVEKVSDALRRLNILKLRESNPKFLES